MKSRCEFVSSPVVLFLLLTTAPVLADESTTKTEFTYSDDWAAVSAPPPPGPYSAVNIDPRVPGVETVPPLPMGTVIPPSEPVGQVTPPSEPMGAVIPPSEPVGQVTPPSEPMGAVIPPSGYGIPAAAPAAGMPSMPRPQDSPASALDRQPATTPVLPERRQRPAPSPSGYYYPAPPRYPAQTRPAPASGYPGYRNQSTYGYSGSPAYRKGPQQVPPPPVYDAMMRNQHPAGKGTP